MARKTKRPVKKGRAGSEAQGADRESGTLREWTKSVVIAVVLFLFMRTFLLQTFVIISGSMEGTLLVGDMLVANRLAMGPRIPGTRIRIPAYSEPRRGDVMVFDPHHEVDMKLVKRIVGLPGDTLEMRDAVLILNGQEVPEPYLNSVLGSDAPSPDFQWQKDYLTAEIDPSTYVPSLHNWGPLVVSPDHYFMLGDNRDASLDSRYWGLLEGWRFEGRVALLYFSYNKESFRPFPAVREIRWGRLGRTIAAVSEGSKSAY